MFDKLFGGKKPAPKTKTLDQMSAEEIKEFQTGIKKEVRDATREIDRQLFASDRLLNESKRELEKKIKEGTDRNALKIYAQNVMKAQSAKDKQMMQKTKIQGVEFNINQMIVSVKMTKTMGDAGKMMGKINALANIPEISKNVQQMQMQMEKIGIVNEMMDDAMEDMNDEVDIDDKAQELLDAMEAKHNPKLKQTNKNKQMDDLDEQLKHLAL